MRAKREFNSNPAAAQEELARTQAAADEPATVKIPVPPQAVALQVYTRLMGELTKQLEEGKLKDKDMPERVRQIVSNTVDCAVMAAGAAQAAIIRAYGEQAQELDVRRTAEHFAQICEGTVKPILSQF